MLSAGSRSLLPLAMALATLWIPSPSSARLMEARTGLDEVASHDRAGAHSGLALGSYWRKLSLGADVASESSKFLQTDPAGFIDGPNLYTAFANDPVNMGDPTGMWTELQYDMLASPEYRQDIISGRAMGPTALLLGAAVGLLAAPSIPGWGWGALTLLGWKSSEDSDISLALLASGRAGMIAVGLGGSTYHLAHENYGRAAAYGALAAIPAGLGIRAEFLRARMVSEELMLLAGRATVAEAAAAEAALGRWVSAGRSGGWYWEAYASRGVVRYGPHQVGPLAVDVASTFRGGSYTVRTLQESLTLYRTYGGSAGPLGRYWTATPPSGPLQAQLDLALAPQWGNAAQSVATIRVPAGTTIYEGFAAPQSTGVGQLLGGGSQFYIPRVDPSWLVGR